jgi:acetamidase/formamidase
MSSPAESEAPMQVIDGTVPSLENLHFSWSKNNKPVAFIEDGETISIIVPDSSTMQVQENWTVGELKKMNTTLLDAAVGPIFVKGAHEGQVLRVDILDIRVGTWGWSSTEKNAPLIRGRFEDNLVIWAIKDNFAESRSSFLKGTRLPVSPFLGIMGVAPREGEYSTYSPNYFGGNMDNKLLTVGSSLLLPIGQEGALLSVADPHAIQGDGEAGNTGLETSATVILRVSVDKARKPIRFPRALVRMDSQEYLVTMGICPDLYEASRIAMSEMIDELSSLGYFEAEAYMLCSLVGDLRISELVDEPNHVVTMMVPRKILVQK